MNNEREWRRRIWNYKQDFLFEFGEFNKQKKIVGDTKFKHIYSFSCLNIEICCYCWGRKKRARDRVETECSEGVKRREKERESECRKKPTNKGSKEKARHAYNSTRRLNNVCLSNSIMQLKMRAHTQTLNVCECVWIPVCSHPSCTRFVCFSRIFLYLIFFLFHCTWQPRCVCE